MQDWIKAFLLSVVAIFAPVYSIMAVAGFLIFADLLTGMWAAKIKGQAITSAGLRRSVSKAVAYQIAIVTGFLIEKYMLHDGLPVSKIIATVASVVEGKSILENLDVIYGKPVFKTVIKKLGSLNDK